jgi:hypothetical protein
MQYSIERKVVSSKLSMHAIVQVIAL